MMLSTNKDIISRLEELTLRMPLKNPIHFHPLTFPYLKKLRIFTKDHTDVPLSLIQLHHLEELTLIGPSPVHLTGHFFFPKLKILRMNKNNSWIHLSSPDHRTPHLPSLEILDLAYNGLHQLPQWIFNLSSLQTLILKKNQFSEIPSDLQKLSALKRIILDNNHIFDFCPTHLPSTLQHFSIDHNPITMKNFPFSSTVIGQRMTRKV
jgi:Leucine-rich repeat (LRR) protein